MANIIKRYIGSDGSVLIPIGTSVDNTNPLVSLTGVYYMAQIQPSAATIVAGNPMGLLLALTYSATP